MDTCDVRQNSRPKKPSESDEYYKLNDGPTIGKVEKIKTVDSLGSSLERENDSHNINVSQLSKF